VVVRKIGGGEEEIGGGKEEIGGEGEIGGGKEEIGGVGVIWSTQRMRFSLHHYGDVVFLDSMRNGANNLRWPFWIPSGINQVPPNSSLRYSNPFQIP